MNCCNIPHAPSSGAEQPSPEEMAADIITYAKDKLKIDLSQYQDQMINAAHRGQLEFTYHGPNILLKTSWGFAYNCELRIINAMHYFFSTAGEVIID